ncbi:UNVERIFIED_ORG: hypothetical protein GGD59_002293 [Rhizobium esperanzae]
MTTKRRQKPANTNRPTNYEFMPYTETGTEVVDDLQPDMVPSWRLHQIARWHDARQARRNGMIASRLRAVAEQQDERAAA